MVFGDNIKNRLDLCWLSPATHGLRPKGFKMPQMGILRTKRSKRARTLVMCSVHLLAAQGMNWKAWQQHGVAERCLRIRLTLVLHVSGCQHIWKSECNKQYWMSHDSLVWRNPTYISNILNYILVLVQMNWTAAHAPMHLDGPGPCNKLQQSIVSRHVNASFWRGAWSIVKFD